MFHAKQSKTYVLIAANIDDFRKIANQFVSGQIVEKFVDAFSNGNPEHHGGNSFKLNEMIENFNEKYLKGKQGLVKVGLDELDDKSKLPVYKDERFEVVKPKNNRLQNRLRIATDINKNTNVEDHLFYEKFDLGKAKKLEEYSNNETKEKRYKFNEKYAQEQTKGEQLNIEKYLKPKRTKKLERDEEVDTIDYNNYGSKSNNNYNIEKQKEITNRYIASELGESIKSNSEEIFVKVTHKGTNMPKKKRYEQFTPNYYELDPTTVDKYNFKEPLPEKDRQREKLTYEIRDLKVNGRVIS